VNGFDGARPQPAWNLLAAAAERGQISGAVAVVGRRGRPAVGPVAPGRAALRPEPRRMRADGVSVASLRR
jgi:hypothetical protein